MKVLIIGAGIIGQEYAKIISHMAIPVVSICRSKQSSEIFKNNTHLDCLFGGIKTLKDSIYTFSHIILASDVESSFEIINFLINNGAKKILIEKPGALQFEEIEKIGKSSQANQVQIYVAYNRRFYSSVMKLKEITEQDGGILSGHFDFTEWSHEIEKLDKSEAILNNWFLLNSTHVVDTAFYILGNPIEMSSFSNGKLSWHTPSIFAGAGITKEKIPFSYSANWSSAGRWMVEIKTNNRTLRLMPMEKLFQQMRGNLDWSEVELDDNLDIIFKPGFYRQVSSFLNNDFEYLKKIEEQVEDLKVYKQMLGFG